MSRFTKKRGEQIRDEIQSTERQYRARRIDESIQQGYEHIWNGELAALAEVMRDILLDDMGVSRHSLRSHAERVQQAAAELQWNHEAVRRFTENPDRYVETLSSAGPQSATERADHLYMKAAGMSPPGDRDREVVLDAFHSLESLAVARGYVSNSVTNWAPAMGYELQLGTWYQPPREDMPYEIQLVNPGDSEEVTVNMGKPGRGKGVMGHTEAEDRYATGRKVLDVVDFEENEGGVYDIPMSNPALREAREDKGLPPDFTEHEEYDRPDVEIMVPLTDGLADEYIPYHGPDATDTVVVPFTVPASRLSKRALKRFISSELTPTQTEIFESAYDQIQRRRDDWNLHDLITAVERHRGLHGNQGAVDRVQRSIRRIQSKGWIRDEDDPHCISWERILTDPDTITVFTASLMPDTDDAAKYLFHSYVIYALRTELKRLKRLPASEREGREWNHVPKVTVIARELHKIAPNAETSADDPTIAGIQSALTSDFRDLTAMHRHEGVEVTSDTQNFIGEIKKRARVNYNRACLFQVNRSPAQQMFEELAGVVNDTYANTVTQQFGVGECAVLGRVGTGRPFEMTVSVAPPMSHHFDPDEWVHPERGITKSREDLMAEIGAQPAHADPDGWHEVNTGWDLRVHLLGEEYRPARELLNATNASDPEQTDLKAVHTEQERPDDAVGQYAWDALGLNPDRRVILDRLEMAYKAHAEQNGHTTDLSRQALSQRFKSQPTPEKEERTFRDVVEHRRPSLPDYPDDRRQTPVYQGVFLKDASAWLDCCDSPEFAVTWGPEDGEPDDREAVGWTCRHCGAGNGAGGVDAAPGERPDTTEDSDGDSGGGEDTTDELETQDDGRDTLTAERHTEPEVAAESLGAFTSTGEDDADGDAPPDNPGRADVDCACPTPEPEPMYAGEGGEEQVGWKCGGCGEKEWS